MGGQPVERISAKSGELILGIGFRVQAQEARVKGSGFRVKGHSPILSFEL